MSQMNDGFQRGAAAEIGPMIEEMLANGECVSLEISGDSMRPTLKPGRDVAVLEPLTAWPPKRGDLLFFRSERSPSGYSLHRVVRTTEKGPVMGGDAQEWTEGPIDRDAVLAKAVALVRGGRLMDVDGRAYRAFVWGWRYTRPVRKPLFALWRFVKRLLGRK